MKSGQINQVFIWLIAALIIGTVALIGARSVGGLLEDKCSIDLIRFQDRIVNEIALANDFGSVDKQELAAPCNFRQMCFVDSRAIAAKEVSFEDESIASRLITNSVLDGVQENIFLVSSDEVRPVGYAKEMYLSEDETTQPLCITATAGMFEFQTRGLGRNTLVYLP